MANYASNGDFLMFPSSELTWSDPGYIMLIIISNGMCLCFISLD